MGKINYRTDDINKKLKQIDELVGSNNNLLNQINNFNSQLDNIENKQNDILINIKDFGVLGNGSDETEKIQIAFDNLQLGQTLYFPIGDYRTRGIIFKNKNGYDIIKIKGESAEQAIIAMGKNYVKFFIDNHDYYKFLFYNQKITVHLCVDGEYKEDYPPYLLLKQLFSKYLEEKVLPLHH